MTNLAYDLRETEVEQTTTKKVVVKKKVAKKQEAVGQKILARFLVFLAFCSIVAFNVLNNYSDLARIKHSIDVKRQENIGLEKEIKLIEAELEQIASSTMVVEIASEKLGMIYPGEENKIYINSREQEYVKEKPKKEIGFMGLFTR